MDLKKIFEIKSQLFSWRFLKGSIPGKDPRQYLSIQDKKYFLEDSKLKFKADLYIFHINDKMIIEAKDKNKDALDSLAALKKSLNKNFPG